MLARVCRFKSSSSSSSSPAVSAARLFCTRSIRDTLAKASRDGESCEAGFGGESLKLQSGFHEIKGLDDAIDLFIALSCPLLCLRLGRVVEAVALLDRMVEDGLQPIQITYGTIVDGMCKKGDTVSALNLLRKMEEVNHIKPNVEGKFFEAEELYDEMLPRGIIPSRITYNSMIDGFCKHNRLDAAEHMFYVMATKGCSPDVITFNTLIEGYCRAKRVDDGLELLHEMTETGLVANTVTYNTLIHGFCLVGDLNAALDLLQEMISSGVCPNVVTCNTLLDGLCDNGKLKDALKMFKAMQKSNMDIDASHPFNGVEPDVQTYNILISGLINEGKFLEAEELYEEMPLRGIVPDTITYIAQ
ncbi:Pentatricopeptide repeat-containing protein [Raphanus sativus]|nr:Pentatricopeptide repeat-containing protein [Raphanus sativus]